jgi:sugar phosphate isomerase/epimerase
MAATSRREFVKAAAATAALAALVPDRSSANPLGFPIGSQTYPHRAFVKEGRFAELLKTLKGLGVDAIELCSPIGYGEFAPLADGLQTRTIIADHGMTCESAHFSMRELRDAQEKSIAWAKDAGITQMITATLGMPPAQAPVTMDYVKKAADEYNRIAAAAAKAGIQQGLHNEGLEMSDVDGRRTYDVLLELLDPALVKLQFQMSTISRGFVAHDYFDRYPGRFFSMHLQDVDLAATPPPPPPGQAGRGAGRGRGVQVPVGKGSIDWVRTFQSARRAGVRNYFVEQNMELTRESVAFLKTLKA